MDGRRFPHEPWSGESENPRANPVGGLWLRRAHFLLVTFSLCEQRKVTRLTLGRRKLLISIDQNVPSTRPASQLRCSHVLPCTSSMRAKESNPPDLGQAEAFNFYPYRKNRTSSIKAGNPS